MSTPNVPMDDAHLKQYAANAAREARPGGMVSCRALSRALSKDLRQVRRVREALNTWSAGQTSLPGAAEWLLDNHYLALREGERASRALKRGKPLRGARSEDTLLQHCARGALWAVPDLDQSRLALYLEGFQSVCPLTERELSLLVPALSGALVEQLAAYAGVPVWNGLTDQFHPTQMLADLLTMEEKFGSLPGLRFTYMGDARNNMGNSLMIACAKMGIHFTACAPKELFPAPELVEQAQAIARENHCTVRLTEDVDEGARGANVIYTDIWVSMGEPDEVWETRIKLLRPYQVNGDVMAKADPGAVFMHCLPSFHDTNTTIGADIAQKFGITEMEVTDQVFESPQSVVFDEAENRMHTIKAVIYATLC